jgi:Leucine-rich repeat (LRR) protein
MEIANTNKIKNISTTKGAILDCINNNEISTCSNMEFIEVTNNQLSSIIKMIKSTKNIKYFILNNFLNNNAISIGPSTKQKINSIQSMINLAS